MALDARKVINGTHGSLWINGEEIAEAKSFQVKVEFQKEEVKTVGSMTTDTKFMGYTVKGSLALHKVNSRMIKYLSNGIKAGKMPKFTLMGKLADPDSEGTERIVVKNVSFDDLTLMDFEVNALGGTECPFTATDWEILDSI